MPSTRSLLITALTAASAALAHIELVFPPPINSKFDPQTLEANKDYSMTSPLATSGTGYSFAYPCKGYNTAELIDALNPVATLEAGTDFSLNMSGSATHGGGSCQFALSYDQGKTFAVIASIIGGCPIAESYTIPVPKSVPAGTKALFAWTWQNLIGNREMYMNCAVVDVKGTSSSYTGPGLFRANTQGDTQCRTVEHQQVVYPNPGPSVQYLDSSVTSSSAATTLSPCSTNQDTSVTVTSNGGTVSGGSSGSASSSSSAAATSTKPKAATNPKATTKKASAAAVAPSSSVLNVTSSRRRVVHAKTSAAVAATSSKRVAAVATSTPVVAGSESTAPAAVASSSGSTPSGSYITCTSASTFSLCGGPTGCIAMGSVAAGTECVGASDGSEGAIAAARTRARRSGQFGRQMHGRRVVSRN